MNNEKQIKSVNMIYYEDRRVERIIFEDGSIKETVKLYFINKPQKGENEK